MNGHPCVVCGTHETPVYRFACHHCYVRMPVQLRRAAARAWKFRIVDQNQYRETLATVLLWHRDRSGDIPIRGMEGDE